MPKKLRAPLKGSLPPEVDGTSTKSTLTMLSEALDIKEEKEVGIKFVNNHPNLYHLEDPDGLTAFQICLSHNRFDVFKRMVEMIAPCEVGIEFLFAALDKNRAGFATQLLLNYPNALKDVAAENIQEACALAFRIMKIINRELHEALSLTLKHLSPVQLTAVINSKDENGCMLLHWACYSALTLDIINLSLANGADMLTRDGSGFLPVQRLACSSIPSSKTLDEKFVAHRRRVIRTIIILTLKEMVQKTPDQSPLELFSQLLSMKLQTHVKTINHLNGSNLVNLAVNTNNKELIISILELLQVFGDSVPLVSTDLEKKETNFQCATDKQETTANNNNNNNNNNGKNKNKNRNKNNKNKNSNDKQGVTDKAEIVSDKSLTAGRMEELILSLPKEQMLLLYYNVFFSQEDEVGKSVFLNMATKGDLYLFGLICSSLTSKTPPTIVQAAFLSTDKLGRGLCHMAMHSNSPAILFEISSTLKRLKMEVKIETKTEGTDAINSWLIKGKGLLLEDLIASRCVTSTKKVPVDLKPLDKERGEGQLTLADINTPPSLAKGKEARMKRRAVAKELKRREVVAVDVIGYGKKVSRDRDLSNAAKILVSTYARVSDRYAMVFLISTLYIVSAILGYVFERDVAFTVAFIALFLFHIYVVRLNPGVVRPRKCKPLEEIHKGEEGTRVFDIMNKHMCPTCFLPKGEGVELKHCPYCNHCVVGFDHCCPWIGNDVGANNHRQFIVLLALGTLFDFFFGMKYVIKAIRILKQVMNFNRYQMSRRGPQRFQMGDVLRMRRTNNVELLKCGYFIFWNFLIGLWCLFLLVDQLCYIFTDSSLNKAIKEKDNDQIGIAELRLKRIIENETHKPKRRNSKQQNSNESKADEHIADVSQDQSPQGEQAKKKGKMELFRIFFSGERKKSQIASFEKLL